MPLLDTNVVSELMKPQCNPAVELWIADQVRGTLFLSAVSLSELLLGIEIVPAGRRKESMSALLGEIVNKHFKEHILPFDEMSARAYSMIMSRGRSMGHAISIPDGQIAAIAQVHNLPVATRDTSPFEAAGVGFANPWEYGQPL